MKDARSLPARLSLPPGRRILVPPLPTVAGSTAAGSTFAGPVVAGSTAAGSTTVPPPSSARTTPSAHGGRSTPRPLPPPTPLSRTVVMASPSHTPGRDRAAAAQMASPPPADSLTPMEVDHILTLTHRLHPDWPPDCRRGLAESLWRRGYVVRTLDGWWVDEDQD